MQNISQEKIALNKGDVLYLKGDPSDCFYIVVSGEITMFNGDEQNMVPVSIVKEKGFVGEQSLFAGQERGLTAIASEFSQVIAIVKDDVDDVLKVCPDWVTDIMRILGERLLSTKFALYEHNVISDIDVGITDEELKFFRKAIDKHNKKLEAGKE